MPSLTPEGLLEMARDFTKKGGLASVFDEVALIGPPTSGAVSGRRGDSFVRLWFVSGEGSFLMATYECAWGAQAAELPVCEAIVETATFPPLKGASSR